MPAAAENTAIDPAGATAELYERDYAQWLLRSAALLRAGRFGSLDIDHIAEELEDMARSEARALRSHLSVLLTHLLKWEHQPEQRSSSWRGSIYNARRAIERLLRESPSLRRRLSESVADIHADAVFNAANETGLAEALFPRRCPYAIEQLLDLGFWPGQP